MWLPHSGRWLWDRSDGPGEPPDGAPPQRAARAAAAARPRGATGDMTTVTWPEAVAVLVGLAVLTGPAAAVVTVAVLVGVWLAGAAAEEEARRGRPRS